MGIWETLTDLVDAAAPWSTAEAEAPASEEQVRLHFHPPSKHLHELLQLYGRRNADLT